MGHGRSLRSLRLQTWEPACIIMHLRLRLIDHCSVRFDHASNVIWMAQELTIRMDYQIARSAAELRLA
jgi:hypothetical protein